MCLIIKENGKQLQEELWKKMSPVVDEPKLGYGNSNDGNIVRKFFSKLSAIISGIDKELIRFYKNLQT